MTEGTICPVEAGALLVEWVVLFLLAGFLAVRSCGCGGDAMLDEKDNRIDRRWRHRAGRNRRASGCRPDRHRRGGVVRVVVDPIFKSSSMSRLTSPTEFVLGPRPSYEGPAYHDDPGPCAGYPLVDFSKDAVADLKRELVVPDRHAHTPQRFRQRANKALLVVRRVAYEHVMAFGHLSDHVGFEGGAST